VWEVLGRNSFGERKERWPYLRAALSSTINYTDSYYTAISQFIPLFKEGYTAFCQHISQSFKALTIIKFVSWAEIPFYSTLSYTTQQETQHNRVH
jgi:hypothetical protein